MRKSLGLLAVLACATAHADTITHFNFNSAPISSPSSGTGVLTNTFSSITTFTGSTINAVSPDVAGNALALVGDTNNGKSITLQFATTGYEDIGLSFATQRTSTGFNSNQLSYSTDNSTYTNFGAAYTPPAAFALQSFDLSSITALNGVANAFLRITFTGATSGSGNNRIDNLQVTGNVANVVPLPPAVLAGSALLGFSAVGQLRKRRAL